MDAKKGPLNAEKAVCGKRTRGKKDKLRSTSNGIKTSTDNEGKIVASWANRSRWGTTGGTRLDGPGSH